MALPLLAAGALAPIVATIIKFAVGYFIARLITSLGMAMVVFASVDSVANLLTNQIEGALGGISGTAHEVLSAVGLYNCVNMIFSAYVSAVGIRQLRGVYNKITFGGT